MPNVEDAGRVGVDTAVGNRYALGMKQTGRRGRGAGSIHVDGAALRALRLSRGHSMNSLARAIGVTATFIGMVEKGKSNVGTETFAALCTELLSKQPDSRVLVGGTPASTSNAPAA